MQSDLQVSDIDYDFINDIDACIKILQMERKSGKIRGGRIRNALIELEIPENLVIVGDLHGDLKSLLLILREIKYENFLANANNKLIFLGDYVDKGTNSIEILQNILYLKCRYPDSVVLMRGNHEAPIEFPFHDHDLPSNSSEQFGKEKGEMIYKKILSLFQLFTVVTIVKNNLILVHGGLPTMINKDIRKLILDKGGNGKQKSVLEELLWNDPRLIQNGTNWEVSRRLYGKHFGPEITRNWLEMTGTKAVVRSHEPCRGFRVDHEGMIMTLFSCKASYQKFEAAYLHLSCQEFLSISNAYDLTPYVKLLDT